MTGQDRMTIAEFVKQVLLEDGDWSGHRFADR